MRFYYGPYYWHSTMWQRTTMEYTQWKESVQAGNIQRTGSTTIACKHLTGYGLPRQKRQNNGKRLKHRISADMPYRQKTLWYLSRKLISMATVHGFFPLVRTIGNLTFYMMDGKNYVRKKSSLSRKKVKTSAAFAPTRQYAGLMAMASRIGSQLYQSLPIRWRQAWMYRTFTGEALKLLKTGQSIEEVHAALHKLYVAPIPNRPVVTAPRVTCKRPYTKKHPSFWQTRARRAQARKLQQQKLMHHARLLAHAARLASQLYNSLPAATRRHSVYKQLTGWVLQMLQHSKTINILPKNHLTAATTFSNPQTLANLQKGCFPHPSTTPLILKLVSANRA